MDNQKKPDGRKRVRDAIASAGVVSLSVVGGTDARAEAASPPPGVSRRFRMTPDGLFRKSGDDDKPDIFVCGPLECLAETRDAEGNGWGLLMGWKDRDGRRHEEAFPRSMFAGDCGELRSRMANGGLTLASGAAAKNAFAEWLAMIRTDERARSVARIGWHALPSGTAYVLPSMTFGATGERVVLQQDAPEPDLFGVAGTAAEWRARVGEICRGNSRLTLAACDALLALDELGQLDPREAGDTAYMLANGAGKARANRTGGARAVSRWRVLFLSTGERTLADLNAEAGRPTKAGQEVRFVDVPADAGAGLGLFEALHHADTAGELAEYLRAETGRLYGAPFRTFMERLTGRLTAEGLPQLREALRLRVAALSEHYLRNWPDASGQVRSVSRRFAIVALGGELATQFGLAGWDADTAPELVRVCFEDWLRARGTTGRREDEQAVEQLRDFISRNGEGRFERWVDPRVTDAPQSGASEPPGERFRTQMRAGWKRWQKLDDGATDWQFYLTSAGMKEALARLNGRDAKKVLVERGFLKPGADGRVARVISPPGLGAVRAYEVRAGILGADAGDAG
ncbi:DUF927 domain-containing protein [Acetobacter sp. DsW_063]|uniref:DUF927 domain-containing protein n=1 Tax=Acetobacter sp. DsW_063 TaxID=1514894 RepID=UPI000A36AE65|nr:DUF927 domain-containing protein [Acetobacter sp. DsW_063]